MEWKSIANEFFNKWNYPCCIGALDGKHISIKQPENSGSQYFNYKHFFSIVLMALVGAILPTINLFMLMLGPQAEQEMLAYMWIQL